MAMFHATAAPQSWPTSVERGLTERYFHKEFYTGAVFIPDSLRRRAESSPKEKFWVLVEAVPGARLAARARLTAHGGVVVPDPDGLPPANPFLFAKLEGDSIAPLEADSADVIASIEEDHE